MASEVFQLYLLLQLKDFASGGLDRIEAKLRAGGRETQEYLQKFEQLRSNMKRDLTVAGIGVGTLAALKKGVDIAAEFESSSARLKASIATVGEDGSVNVARLNSEMESLNRTAVQLGNTLPGSTADFLDMMTELRRTGVSVEDINAGAARAVAMLAIATEQQPKEIARQYGRLAKQFQLKPEEYKPSAALFAQLSSIGLEPQELIEGAKFAQLRGGLPLGLRGIKGLHAMAMMLGSMQQVGLSGGIGGREMAGFLMALAPVTKEQKKADVELRHRGIDLQFFNKQGTEFLGEENVIKQIAKLEKLTVVERQSLLKKRFETKEAIGPISAMLESAGKGGQGWKNLIDFVHHAADEEQKAAIVTATYTAKQENLSGTLQNLTATGFTPMLERMKPVYDLMNNIAAGTEVWLHAHQGYAAYGTSLIAIGAAAATASGGIGLARNSMRLLGMEALTVKGILSSLAQPIKIAIFATELVWVLSELRELKSLRDAVEARNGGTSASGRESVTRLQALQKMPGVDPLMLQRQYALEANAAFANLNQERTLREQMAGGTGQILRSALNVSSYQSGKSLFDRLAEFTAGSARFLSPSLLVSGWALGTRGLGPEQNPFWRAGQSWSTLHPERGAQVELFRQRSPELQTAEVMAQFIKAINNLKDWPEEAKQNLLGLAKESYPESFQKGVDIYSQSFATLTEQTQKTADGLNNLNTPLMTLPGQFTNAGSAAQRFSDRLDSLELKPPSAPAAYPAAIAPKGPLSSMVFGGGRAEGGRALKGVTYVGGERGMELFTPDINGFIWSHDKLMAIARTIGAASGGWSPLVREDLDLLGQPESLLPHVMRRIMQESRGNPAAINLWDSNAKAGHPSIGLMQVIKPTFERYAGPLGGRGIYDPLANIYAGLNYAQQRYPNLQYAMDKPGGYDQGGWLMPGKFGTNNTGRPEAVLTPTQSAAFIKVAARGDDGQVVHHHHHHHHTTNHVTVNVPPGSRAADEPEELAAMVAQALQIQMERS